MEQEHYHHPSNALLSQSSWLLIISLLFFCSLALADVKLPKIIWSNMVLQRDEPVQIWGWADKNEKVTVKFNNQTAKTKTKASGEWKVSLKPMPAGGPFEMEISGKNKLVLNNILIGDVWICSGQSNMQWSVSQAMNSEQEIAAANYPNIRLFSVPRVIQFQPVDDVSGGEWLVTTPETIGGFSAVGYFFGRELHQHLGIPIGLINTSWGGTNVETWTSAKAIGQLDEFKAVVAELDTLDVAKIKARVEAKFAPLKAELAKTTPGLVDGKALWASPEIDTTQWQPMKLPILWEEAGLEGVDGVIWFRKEFTLTETKDLQNVVLSLGPIDDSDITWVNGIKIGETLRKYDEPRFYKLDSTILQPGKNVVTVRVEDYGGGGGLWGKPDDLYLQAGTFKLGLSGDWQYRISPVNFAYNVTGVGPNSKPTLLFNAMIHPLLPYRIKGAIWYQGESNAGRAYKYRTLFPLMIQDWRNHWDQGDFPFLFVQLANFMQPDSQPSESAWAELREAQLMTLKLPNTGMAVIIDIGEADDIHPRNKQDVGYRLALAARKVSFGEEIVYSGPLYDSMAIEGNKIRIFFKNVGSGLMIKDKYGYLKGFAIAGPDRKFVWAKATLDGNDVLVYNETVQNPVAVRFGWANNPDDINLYNQEGLPASPFRTDDWPGITVDK